MYTLWHHPKCSKSRAALTWLETQPYPFEVYLYQENAPDFSQLKALSQALNLPPWSFTRLTDELAQTLHLSALPHEEALWFNLLAQHPSLIERPILVSPDGRARIGRPLEQLEALLPPNSALS